eukprot:TRINITY_DN1088_c0_g1_i6.p1 TRINITY_DN1088_c0_g1~~TRINITY_DN1088_c0_g1_i6.p1  ORF type:complete len:826 (-),score=346.64 TRINITY_DN1088_c0_g1_i6:982-3459(-)
MEVGAIIVFLAVFLGCGGIVFAISFFGTQTETFEEALEKQRNQQKEKEKKKEKKPVAEKKKKLKKGKDAKNNNIMEFEEEALVDPAGELVEPVYITEPAAAAAVAPVVIEEPKQPAPVKEEVVKPVEKTKKEEKKEKKKEEKAVKAPAPAPAASVVVEQAVPLKSAPKAAENVPAANEAAAAVTAAPVATPAAQASSNNNNNKEQKVEKKKMEIQEVTEIQPEETEEKKKKKGGNKGAKKKSHYEEVLDTVRRVPLTNTEAQGIVDVLLLKQTGRDGEDEGVGDGEWQEPGKETEAKKMTRQMAELSEQLEEEKSKSSGLEKKMASLRKEMTDGKSQLTSLKRDMEELNRTKAQELNNHNTTVQQLRVEVNTAKTYNIQLEANYKQEITSLKDQLERAQVSSPSDTMMVAEIEQLKKANAELSQTNSSLQHKFTQKCSEVDSSAAAMRQQNDDLTAQLTAAKAAQEQLTSQLSTANSAQSRLTEELKNAEEQKSYLQGQLDKSNSQSDASQVSSQQLENQLSAITAAKLSLQSELTSLKEKLSEKEKETSRLLEENERLSEQVASSVERPAAEGEESVNGHPEMQQKEPEVEKVDWEEKYNKLTAQLTQRESKVCELEASLAEYNSQVDKLQSKNNAVSSEYSEYKKSCLAMLGQLFPAAVLSGEKSENLKEIQSKAQKFIQDLEKSADSASRVDSLTQEIQKLEAQSVSYKTVLAQTENMLTSLQTSVEGAELEWKKKLEASESECKDMKKKVTELQNANTELLQKLKDTASLSDELEAEKSSKDVLARKCSELQQLIAIGEKQLQLANSQEEVVTNGEGESEA